MGVNGIFFQIGLGQKVLHFRNNRSGSSDTTTRLQLLRFLIFCISHRIYRGSEVSKKLVVGSGLFVCFFVFFSNVHTFLFMWGQAEQLLTIAGLGKNTSLLR